MITLNDILEAASVKVRGDIVLYRSMTVHPTVKAYKVFKYSIYHIVDGCKIPRYEHSYTKKALSDELEKVWETCDKEFLIKLIEWFTSDIYKDMTNEI